MALVATGSRFLRDLGVRIDGSERFEAPGRLAGDVRVGPLAWMDDQGFQRESPGFDPCLRGYRRLTELPATKG